MRFRKPVLLQYAGENGIISNHGIAAEAKSVYHPKGKDVMCGIVGFVGSEQAAPILLEGLERLEYRGYDSAGIAVVSKDKELQLKKAKGRLKVLSDIIQGGKSVEGTIGIGHTRWATHGEPNDVNAHPHLSGDGKVAVVHNGIIENYVELRDFLLSNAYEFKCETDTEVVAQLLA